MELTFDGPMDMNDDESKLMDEISIQVPTKKTVPLRPKPARPSPFTKRAPGPVEPQGQEDAGLDMFMNPGKRTAPPVPPPEEFDGGEECDEYEDQGSNLVEAISCTPLMTFQGGSAFPWREPLVHLSRATHHYSCLCICQQNYKYFCSEPPDPELTT